MSLARLIRDRKDVIIDRWTHLAREVLEAADEVPRLQNDLPVVLDQLADFVETPHGGVAAAAAGGHGEHRHQEAFSIVHLVREYGLILEVVLEAVEESEAQVAPEEVRRFSRALFEAQSQSVETYVALRDAELAERAAEHRSFIGHEIRTPLTAARFAYEVLERTSQASPALARLGRSLERLKHTVDDALTEARIASERNHRMERISLGQVSEDALEDVRLAAERQQLDLVKDVPADLHVEADRRLLHSVLTNLLGNAVKFSHQGSVVRLRARPLEGDAVRLEVEDGCGGLQPGDGDRIFGKFVQTGGDRSGFGVGLSIVRQAVEAHRGEISVENRPGSGCVMKVDLPARQPSSTASTAPDAPKGAAAD